MWVAKNKIVFDNAKMKGDNDESKDMELDKNWKNKIADSITDVSR